MMTSLFDIGLSGLRATKNAMYLIGNNIANANNPHFSRREVDFLEITPGLFGNGVTLGDVRRIANTMADRQLLSTSYHYAQSEALFDRLKNLETYVDNEDTSVVKFINQSLTALEALNASPSSLQERSHYLNQLKNMATRVRDVNEHLSNEKLQSRQAISTNIEQVNGILGKLAQINEKNAFNTPVEKMALYDQRDKLLQDLSRYISFDTQTDDNGITQINFSNGLPLLMHSEHATFEILPDNGSRHIEIGLQLSGNSTQVTNLIQGGEIGGLLDYMENKLSKFQNSLDQLALSIAYKMNERNKLGMDAQGNLGNALFNDPNQNDMAHSRVTPKTENTGLGDVSVLINDPGRINNTDYELRFDNAGQYQIIRLSDGEILHSGTLQGLPSSIEGEGFQILINNGSFMPGDVYTLSPTSHAAMNLQIAIDNPSKLALGLPVSTSVSEWNKGKGQITLAEVLDTSNPAFSIPQQLNPPVRIEFNSATSYSIINSANNTLIESNLVYDPAMNNLIFPTPGGFDPGYRVQISGAVSPLDQFSIDYNLNGAGDNRNGVLMSELYRSGTIASNDLTFSQGYQRFMFDISSSVNNSKINLETLQILKQQAQATRDESSAVSLEEESMNLSRMQESYMACAQVLDVIKQTMDMVFSLLRR